MTDHRPKPLLAKNRLQLLLLAWLRNLGSGMSMIIGIRCVPKFWNIAPYGFLKGNGIDARLTWAPSFGNWWRIARTYKLACGSCDVVVLSDCLRVLLHCGRAMWRASRSSTTRMLSLTKHMLMTGSSTRTSPPALWHCAGQIECLGIPNVPRLCRMDSPVVPSANGTNFWSQSVPSSTNRIPSPAFQGLGQPMVNGWHVALLSALCGSVILVLLRTLRMENLPTFFAGLSRWIALLPLIPCLHSLPCLTWSVLCGMPIHERLLDQIKLGLRFGGLTCPRWQKDASHYFSRVVFVVSGWPSLLVGIWSPSTKKEIQHSLQTIGPFFWSPLWDVSSLVLGGLAWWKHCSGSRLLFSLAVMNR